MTTTKTNFADIEDKDVKVITRPQHMPPKVKPQTPQQSDQNQERENTEKEE